MSKIKITALSQTIWQKRPLPGGDGEAVLFLLANFQHSPLFSTIYIYIYLSCHSRHPPPSFQLFTASKKIPNEVEMWKYWALQRYKDIRNCCPLLSNREIRIPGFHLAQWDNLVMLFHPTLRFPLKEVKWNHRNVYIQIFATIITKHTVYW